MAATRRSQVKSGSDRSDIITLIVVRICFKCISKIVRMEKTGITGKVLQTKINKNKARTKLIKKVLRTFSLVTKAAAEKAEADLSLDLWPLVAASQLEENYIID